MHSSTMRTIANINAVLGVIGSLIMAVSQGKIAGFAAGLITFIVYIFIIGESVFMLYAVATIMENIESVMSNEKRILRLIGGQETSGVSHTPQHSAGNSSGYVGNTWRCPKCGKSNPISSRVCKDCGYNK